MYFVQTCKAKQGLGYVESDEIREVTPTRQNCNQTHRKGLNIKSVISVNVDVFNRRFVMQFPKVALDYDFDLSRCSPVRKVYSETKFTYCFVCHVGTLHCQSKDMLWGYSVRQRSYKQDVFVFRISFVVESLVTIHTINIVLGHTIKNT
jgi:hypothetical protein